MSSEEITNSSTSTVVNDSSGNSDNDKILSVSEDDKVNDDVSVTSDVTTPTPFEADDLVCDESLLNSYLVDEHNCINSTDDSAVTVPFSACDKIPVLSQILKPLLESLFLDMDHVY